MNDVQYVYTHFGGRDYDQQKKKINHCYLCDIVNSLDNVLHYIKVSYRAIMLICPVTHLSCS